MLPPGSSCIWCPNADSSAIFFCSFFRGNQSSSLFNPLERNLRSGSSFPCLHLWPQRNPLLLYLTPPHTHTPHTALCCYCLPVSNALGKGGIESTILLKPKAPDGPTLWEIYFFLAMPGTGNEGHPLTLSQSCHHFPVPITCTVCCCCCCFCPMTHNI